MEDALQAFAEPRRREILRLIGGREMTAGDIATHFSVTRPAISQHLQVLKRSGLAEERREGAKRYYRARPEGLEPIREYIDAFWSEGLERLKAEAEREHRRDRAGRRGRSGRGRTR